MAGSQPAEVYRSLYTLEVISRDQNNIRKQRTSSLSGNSPPKYRHKPQRSNLNWNIFEGKDKFSSYFFARQCCNPSFPALVSLVKFITEKHHKLDRIIALTLLYAFTCIGMLIRYIRCACNS